jgi:hypothetical protein
MNALLEMNSANVMPRNEATWASSRKLVERLDHHARLCEFVIAADRGAVPSHDVQKRCQANALQKSPNSPLSTP